MQNLGELIAAFRERSGDTVEPFLWSDEDAARFASDAQREAAVRSRLLRDSETAALRQLSISAHVADIGLSPLVLDVERARLDGVKQPLVITSVAAMDAADPEWESHTEATPTRLVLDRGARTMRAYLWPTPAAACTLLLTVIRLPLADLTDSDDALELPAQHHEALIDWMLHKAYRKPDSETYDKQASEDAAARFTASFGPNEGAAVYRSRAERRPSVVAFNPF